VRFASFLSGGFITPKYSAKAEVFLLFGLLLRPPKFYSKSSAFGFVLKMGHEKEL
jgi:hypothetical protein